ncbi:MAG: glycine cleavage system aminomethyltransferase GcvT, partial [Steroidobacteraceae bacterium]
MGRRTPLYELHRSSGARLIDFGGWELPLHYGSQIDEHHAVRRTAGIFDVSHMGIADVRGRGARALLERLIANDVGKLDAPGKALYGCLLNAAGGVIDDLIVYRLAPGDAFRVVVNGATREGDFAWMREHAARLDAVVEERDELALLAIQGPQAREQVAQLLEPAEAQAALGLGRFRARSIGSAASTDGGASGGGASHGAASNGTWFIARTGYTGEDGFEVMLPAGEAEVVWRRLADRGVVPCGLGARDTLRLEAGLNLDGQDMDAATHPDESRLGWTVALEPR